MPTEVQIYKDGTIVSADIADNAVIATKIAAGAVGTSVIADNAVIATKIADNAVTASKIAATQVSKSFLAIDSNSPSGLTWKPTIELNLRNGQGSLLIGNYNVTSTQTETRGTVYSTLSAALNLGTTNGQNCIGFVFGTSVVGGISPTGTAFSNSDIRLKENIIPLKYGLNEILNLKPSFFNFKTNKKDRQVGLIAQEVEPFIPEAIHMNAESDIKHLCYDPIVTTLINAVKELSSKYDTLQKKFDDYVAQHP